MAGGCVYILTNRQNGILYVGVTNDLICRMFEHRSGFVDDSREGTG
jgi:putative endonuclease